MVTGMDEILQALYHRLQFYKELGFIDMPRMKRKASKKDESLEKIKKELGDDCMRCKLHKGRHRVVFGEGNPKAELMFIGEAPGRDEDLQGKPFVGRAGQLLTKIIEAMKLKRSDVYITNVVKCRPPENRAPQPDEVDACEGFLFRQINVIKPRIIVCLGSVACQNLLKTEKKISGIRGQWQDWNGIQVMPTYHPAYLLRNPEAKKEVWNDMKKVMEELSPRHPDPERSEGEGSR